MKRIFTLFPALFAGNIRPGTLRSSCSLNGNVQIDFSYEPADMNLGFAFVGTSNSTTCGHGTNQLSLTKTDDQAGTWKINYNQKTCGYDGDIMMHNAAAHDQSTKAVSSR